MCSLPGLVVRPGAEVIERVVEVRFSLVQLARDVTVAYVDGGRFARHADQKVPQLRRQVAESQDGEHVPFVQRTQLRQYRDHFHCNRQTIISTR